MTRHISSEKARANWREILDAVANGEVVVIERYGRPVATLMPYIQNAPATPRSVRESAPTYDVETLEQLKAEIVADLLSELSSPEPGRRTWREELDELRASIAENGGLNVGETTEEIVEHMRRIRQEIFEAEYAHLYR
jgi:prevent-host-death family protein